MYGLWSESSRRTAGGRSQPSMDRYRSSLIWQRDDDKAEKKEDDSDAATLAEGESER
jgi:hypothetical protein